MILPGDRDGDTHDGSESNVMKRTEEQYQHASLTMDSPDLPITTPHLEFPWQVT